MAKNPASFQKRQRELDKKRKAEDKRKRRLDQKRNPTDPPISSLTEKDDEPPAENE